MLSEYNRLMAIQNKNTIKKVEKVEEELPEIVNSTEVFSEEIVEETIPKKKTDAEKLKKKD